MMRNQTMRGGIMVGESQSACSDWRSWVNLSRPLSLGKIVNRLPLPHHAYGRGREMPIYPIMDVRRDGESRLIPEKTSPVGAMIIRAGTPYYDVLGTSRQLSCISGSRGKLEGSPGIGYSEIRGVQVPFVMEP